MIRWLIPIVFAGACTSFDPVARGTCGNGLLEPGEDCDTTDATCVKCAVVCASAATCPTSDYTCGVDGFCHAPSGTLAPPTAVGAFQYDEYEVTDIDRDHIGDVIGVSKSSLVVRHGDATGSLVTTETQVTPAQTGTAGFGDLDLDGSLDVTIGTPDGVVAYTSPFGELSPLIVEGPITPPGGTQNVDLRMLFSISPFAVGAFVSDPNGHLALIVVDFVSGAAPTAIPCNQLITASDFSISQVDIYQVNKDSDVASDTVVAMVTGTGAAAKLCVMSLHKDNLLAAATIADITPAGAPVIKRRAVFADLDNDNDRCPDLVTSEIGAGSLRHWNGTMLAGHCALIAVLPNGDVLPAVAGATTSAVGVGHATFDPPASFYGTAFAPDALVLTDGLYGYAPAAGGSFTRFYQSARKLSRAVNADLNNDGRSDVVLSADTQSDLDVLYREVSFLNSGFQQLRIVTASEVTSVTLDDFDGNGIKDIAYTERLSGHQRLNLVFSTTDHPLDPITVGTFADITSVVRIQFLASDDPLLQIADLIVVEPGPPSTLALLTGSTQRTMIPYLDPRSNTPDNVPPVPSNPLAQLKNRTTLRAALIGHLAPTAGMFPDVAGIAPNSYSTAVRGWLMAGSSKGLDAHANDGFAMTGVADCSSSATGSVCLEDARFGLLPVSPTRDLILAIDRPTSAAVAPNIALIDPSTSASGTVGTTPVPAMVVPAGNLIRTLRVADVDGDGAVDLVAAFEPKTTATKGTTLVCKLAAGIPQMCQDLVPLITTLAPSTKHCLDVALGHFGFRDPATTTNPTPDLLMLCRDTVSTVYRVHHEADGFHADALVHSASNVTWSAVRAGDVTGDGVDDVLIVDGDKGSRSLFVYRQCTSHDTSGCKTDGSKP
ncbi:MAG: hypothetical protein JWO36_4439 [Myxococcales bacterium]|nr:hypothetical protein [Myxococcales bacterium]